MPGHELGFVTRQIYRGPGDIVGIAQATGCENIEYVLQEVHKSIDPDALEKVIASSEEQRAYFVDEVARLNVLRTVDALLEESETLAALVKDERVAIVGAIYDVATGDIRFFE